MNLDNTDLILCECYSDEHQIIFRYNNDDDFEEVYVTYHLDNTGFWWRVKKGMAYIFGKKSKYGHFGELILPPNQDTIDKLEKVVNKLKNVKSNNDNKKNKKYYL